MRFLTKLKKHFQANKADFFLIIVYVVFILGTYEFFNRPFGQVRNLEIPLDDKIPFVKELILVYHTYFPLVIACLALASMHSKRLFHQLLASLLFAQVAAYVIYVNFQTYVPRYDVSKLGNDFFSWAVKYTYSIDNSYSGAPSLHVCDMFISAWFFSKMNFSKGVKVWGILYMTLAAATTDLVKQHVILDVPAGLAHGILSCLIVAFVFKKLSKSSSQ